MRIIFSIDDFIKEFEPFYNGCSFSAVIDKLGNLGLTFGCYHLVNLQTGFGSELQYIIKNSPNECLWNISNEKIKKFHCEIDFDWRILKVELLRIIPCKHCGGIKLENLDGK